MKQRNDAMKQHAYVQHTHTHTHTNTCVWAYVLQVGKQRATTACMHVLQVRKQRAPTACLCFQRATTASMRATTACMQSTSMQPATHIQRHSILSRAGLPENEVPDALGRGGATHVDVSAPHVDVSIPHLYARRSTSGRRQWIDCLRAMPSSRPGMRVMIDVSTHVLHVFSKCSA